jgi:hypothetical protein
VTGSRHVVWEKLLGAVQARVGVELTADEVGEVVYLVWRLRERVETYQGGARSALYGNPDDVGAQNRELTAREILRMFDEAGVVG